MVKNEGTSLGSTTCRISDPTSAAGQAAIVQSPRIQPGATLTFDATVTGLGTLAEAAHRGVLVAVTVGGAPASTASATAAADLAFASELARTAGRVLMDRYERVERIDYKSARDVVTEVDHLSEALIIAAIRERYPADGILAEESGGPRRRRGRRPDVGQRPRLDHRPGRRDDQLRNGIPFFCVSIGLAVDGRPSVGRRPRPDPGRALRGRGRRAGDAQRRADRGLRQGQAVGLRRPDGALGRSVASRAKAVRKQIRISRSMGSSALGLAYVANGRFDAFIQQGGMSNWDVAAAALIAERAGATVTAMDGGPWFDLARKPDPIGALAAPAAHHAALLGLVEEGERYSFSQRCGRDRSRSSPHWSQNPCHVARGAPRHSRSLARCCGITTPSSRVRSRARDR